MAKQASDNKTGEVPHPESDDKILYLFTYLLTWISGILIYITVGQKNKRMKFHAIQAILLGLLAFIVALIPLPFFFIGGFIIWLYGMYIALMAYDGRDIAAPVIGEYATKYSA